MTSKPRLLFMCVANSARSQLAEGVAKQVFGDRADIKSAGSQPTKVNPFAARALTEVGADTKSLYSKMVADLPSDFVEHLDYVITLCAEEVCPIIISKAKKLHWPLPDPAGKDGADDEQMARFRSTRDEIRKRLEAFAKDFG
jgi:arsenate reductase (thioredoxin)